MAIIKKKRLDKLKSKASELLNRTFEQHINLTVTGLSRSGKTAFITPLHHQTINACLLYTTDAAHQKNTINTSSDSQNTTTNE